MPISEQLCNPNTGDYSRLVQGGYYSTAPSGLWGKFDNVRRYWENQITRFALAPAVERLRSLARAQQRQLRVADLGCGSGEGWSLLMQIPAGGIPPGGRPHLLHAKDVESYHGVDICPDMVGEASRTFESNAAARFNVCDLTEPDGFLNKTDGFDLYYSSYGSLSHLDDEQLRGLLEKLSAHARPHAVLVLDLLGQYSIEWPRYWGYSRNPGARRMQPYSMTWLYPPEEQASHRGEFADYRIRYWGGAEIREFLERTPGLSQRIRGLSCIDRSVLIGRHVDTSEFNPEAKALRHAVNALFEFNHHPRPAELRAPHVPLCKDPEVRDFYRDYCALWNAVADVYRAAVEGGDAAAQVEAVLKKFDLHPNVAAGLQSFAAQPTSLKWMEPGDPIANALQPQFALLLRNLEFHSQRGLGCGHGLLAVVELD